MRAPDSGLKRVVLSQGIWYGQSGGLPVLGCVTQPHTNVVEGGMTCIGLLTNCRHFPVEQSDTCCINTATVANLSI